PVGLDEIGVRECRLRILVEILHVAVCRRRVEIEVVLLDVLAVIAFVAGEPEYPLLEDRVAPVPQREREAEPSVVVADSRDSVLAPSIRPRAGVIVREGVPGRAAGAVVFADRAPLPLGEIGPPSPPVGRPITRFLQSRSLVGHHVPHAHRVRLSINCSKKPRSGGRLENSAWNASRSTARRFTLPRLRTVADRGRSLTSAISPKVSPGPSRRSV